MVSGPNPGLAERAGGEAGGGSTLAVVSAFCRLDDEDGVPLLLPIGTVSRGGLTVGGMAPEVGTRSIAGDMPVALSL